MMTAFDKTVQYTMPFLHDLTHLPSSAPMWQRGMLASAAALEIASLAIPASRLAVPLAERSIYHLSKSVSRNTGLFNGAQKTTSLAFKKTFRQAGARSEGVVGKSVVPKGGLKNVFPRHPKDLLPGLPRDSKGYIYANEKIRIKPEKHPLFPGEVYNPRHHGQHYHIEIRTDVSKSWNNENYTYYLKPDNYQKGMGTGFIPGEVFPGS